MTNKHAVLVADRITKNKVRFQEVDTSTSTLSPYIESVYVPKHTLSDIGWETGKKIRLIIEVEG
jgi:hypothetical protein